MGEMRKCPFCGGGFEVVNTIYASFNLVHNKQGLCVFPRVVEFSSEELLEKFINTRPLEDALSAENAKLRTELDNAYKVIADYQAKIQPADCGELLD